MARTVARIVFSHQSKRMRKPSNTPCCGLAWNGVACVEWSGSLPWRGKPLRGKPLRAGSKRTSRTGLMSKKRFCLPHQMLCSHEMKSEVVCRRQSKNAGCGQPCAAERGRLWLSSSVTAAKQRVFVFGRRSRRDTHCHPFSDFWQAYQHAFPAETHRCVGKETGETAPMERWNNTLRQRVGRYMRQT